MRPPVPPAAGSVTILSMRGRALALLVLPWIVACGDGGGGGTTPTPTPVAVGRLTIDLLLPAAPDPFAGLDGYRATVFDSGGGVVTSDEFDVNEDIILSGLAEGTGLTFRLEGLLSGATVSRGTTLPFDLTETFDQHALLYFAQIDTFNDVSGSPAVRTGAAVAPLSDGRILIAGGSVGGAATDTAEIYDPETDTVTAIASMNAPHTGTPGVLVEPDVVLIAGGADDVGAETSAADLFVYDASAHTGTWPSIPTMNAARADAAVVAIGNDHVLVAGGGAAGGSTPLLSTEVFGWDGSTGVWQTGPDMAVERTRLFGFSTANDEAFIGGGFTGAGGANAWDDGAEHYSYNAGNGGNLMSAGSLTQRRGAAGQVSLPGGTFLLLGGRAGVQNNLQDSTEEVAVAGNNVQAAAGGTLPAAQELGGGGTLPDGRVLVLGGDDGAPVDQALIYDPTGNSFTPMSSSPGPTVGGSVLPLPDGTSLVVVDGHITRYNP